MEQRRRAAAVARHYRDQEKLAIAEIARRLGRAEATVKAYLYDPTGEKARAVKARYQGVCRGCGAYTQPRNRKGDAYAYCNACHPGAIERRWTRSACWQRCASRTGNWLVDLHFRNANPIATADFAVGLALADRPQQNRFPGRSTLLLVLCERCSCGRGF